jgi:hypothetical protein
METIFIQLITNLLLAVWGAIAALPHHGPHELHIIYRVLTRLLNELGDL